MSAAHAEAIRAEARLETMARRSFRDQTWDELTVVAEGPYIVSRVHPA
jgi:hypothetical protein